MTDDEMRDTGKTIPREPDKEYDGFVHPYYNQEQEMEFVKSQVSLMLSGEREVIQTQSLLIAEFKKHAAIQQDVIEKQQKILQENSETIKRLASILDDFRVGRQEVINQIADAINDAGKEVLAVAEERIRAVVLEHIQGGV